MLQTIDYDLQVRGTGDSKMSAFNNIFSQIKPLIARTFPNYIIIKIEPKDIELISASQQSYVEKFFGLLFPRTRTCYNIAAKITVQLSYIEAAKIPFEQHEATTSLTQRVLKMG